MTRPSPSTGLVERMQKREHYFRNAVEGEYDANLLMHARFHIEELASGHTALLEDNERLYAWLADTQMLAFKWMEAHDKLKAGKPYEFPKPADLPERVAALLREIEVLTSALERLDRNFDLLLRGKPVRDVAETKAEVVAALSRPLAERE